MQTITSPQKLLQPHAAVALDEAKHKFVYPRRKSVPFLQWNTRNAVKHAHYQSLIFYVQLMY